jgi:hypothetical protein
MSQAIRVGLALLVVGLYFSGTWLYGVRTGQSWRAVKGESKRMIVQAEEPDRFEANQRSVRNWGFGALGVSAILLGYGLVQRHREKAA